MTRPFHIQVQTTPNPNSLKFVPGIEVLGEGRTVNFTSLDQCSKSPLARQLLQIDGVSAIMLGADFVTISKKDDVNWKILKPAIFGTITDFFNSNAPIINEVGDASEEQHDSPVVKQIKELLDDKIRPVVQEDGGDITFHSFDETTGVVRLKLQGACTNCPSSSITLQNGVCNMLKFFIPEVTDVEQLEDELDTQSDRIFQELQKKLKKVNLDED